MLFLSELGLSLDTVYELDDFTFFSSTIKQLCYEYNSNNPLKDYRVQLYVKLLFTKLAETTYSSYSSDKKPFYTRLERIRSSIQNHPMHDWNIDNIAARVSEIRRAIREEKWHFMTEDERMLFLCKYLPEEEFTEYYDLFSDFRCGGYRLPGDLIMD